MQNLHSQPTGSVQHTTLTLRSDHRAVGQGIFYTGRITEYQSNMTGKILRDFTFVYDCGVDARLNPLGDQALNGEICSFCQEVGQELDLLVISHFDNDHISGLTTLLKKFPIIRTVILPYLHPQDRLLLIAKALASDTGS